MLSLRLHIPPGSDSFVYARPTRGDETRIPEPSYLRRWLRRPVVGDAGGPGWAADFGLTDCRPATTDEIAGVSALAS